MEKKSHIGWLEVNGERRELTRANVSVWRHLGNAALYDHVFLTIGPESGAYIWSDNPVHDELAQAAVEAEATLHLNLQEASPTDVQQFIEAHTEDADSLPDWLPEL